MRNSKYPPEFLISLGFLLGVSLVACITAGVVMAVSSYATFVSDGSQGVTRSVKVTYTGDVPMGDNDHNSYNGLATGIEADALSFHMSSHMRAM